MRSKLNAAQRAAVEHVDGSLLVLAGAGSGKTRVITQRIARLIERGVAPDSVLAVSFTNKASAEMGERLARLVGEEPAARVWLSTFHSFGVRFLTEEGGGKRTGRFVIFDQEDSLGLVREILRRERPGERRLDPMAVLSRISLWKNRFLGPEQVPESDFEYDAVAREVYPAYEASLRAMRAVDFDDLVVVPVRMLRDAPERRRRWRERFRHVLVDEFQDTNRAQLELVKLLANEQANVCVVGDDDQSIYGWRGAEVGNILAFEDHFPGTKVIKLEDNYRSLSPVLDVANAVIARGANKRHEKTLRPARGTGDKALLCTVDDAETEAKFVVSEIKRLERDERRRPGEVAVLYRSSMQARLVEEELRVAGVPYRVYGGTQFFDRKEVKDAAAYLRVVLHPRDELSLRRIVNYPPRGIGGTSIERIAAHANGTGMSFARAFNQVHQIEGIPDAAKRSAYALQGALQRARKRFRGGEGLAMAARELFREVGLEEYLNDPEGGPSAARRWQNVEALLRSIERFEANERENKPSLASFLAMITLRVEQEKEEAGNRVTLSTLHAAKGLEFPVVFLLGCVEGLLPHTRTTDPKLTEASPADVEEERRLFYVGVTRACDALYLLRPERRKVRGKSVKLAPSRFLEGIPEHAVEERTVQGTPAIESAELADMAKALLDRLGPR
ncbi:MAG: ATP-dependent helicase [Myxococcota bacterium]